MSKTSKLAQRAADAPFSSRAEALGAAEFVLGGKKPVTYHEAVSRFGDAADALDLQFWRFDENMKALLSAEVAITKHADGVISASKNLAGQVGNALARIDKVVVRDFEVKLNQLERFVAAMKELDTLQRAGRLDNVIAAFQPKQ